MEQTADRFRTLSQSTRAADEDLKSVWHGRTEWECAVLQAVAYARSLSRSDPDRFDGTMIEIDAEAAALLESDTPLR